MDYMPWIDLNRIGKMPNIELESKKNDEPIVLTSEFLMKLNIVIQSRFIVNKVDNTNAQGSKSIEKKTNQTIFKEYNIEKVIWWFDKTCLWQERNGVNRTEIFGWHIKCSLLVFSTIKLSIVLFEDNKMFAFDSISLITCWSKEAIERTWDRAKDGAHLFVE